MNALLVQVADFAFVPPEALPRLRLPEASGLRLLTLCKQAFTAAVLSANEQPQGHA